MDNTVGKLGKVYSTQPTQSSSTHTSQQQHRVSAGQTSFLIADGDRLTLLNQQQKSGAASILDTGEVLFLQRPQNIPLPRGSSGGGGGIPIVNPPPPPPPPPPVILGKSVMPHFGPPLPPKTPHIKGEPGKLVAPMYNGTDVTFSKYDQKKGDMVEVSANGVDIQRALKEVFDELNDSDSFRADNVMQFLASVAAASGRRDVKMLYKSPQEILEDFPGGMEYLHTRTSTFVKQTITTNRRANTSEVSYTVPVIDRFNQIVHAALSPSKLGRIFIKPVIMAFIRDAFTQVRAFNYSFRAIPNVGTIMNSDDNDVRNYFGKLVGLLMRLEDARSGSARTFNASEDRILRDIGLLVNGRLSYFIYRGGGEFYDSITDDPSTITGGGGGGGDSYKRQRLNGGDGPSYSFSGSLQVPMK